MVLLGIICVGLGILILVARDFFWALTEMGNSFAGRTSERTELWETGQVISGVGTILVGAFIICAGSAEDRQREERRIAPTQTAVAVEALAVTLDSTFAEFIPQWERSIESGVQNVRPASIGVYALDLAYGRCDDNQFFIAVEGYNGRYGEDYLYLPEGDPMDCDNGELRFFGGRDSNVAWRRVTIVPDNTADYLPSDPTLQALLSGTPTPTRQPTERPAATPTRQPGQRQGG